MLRRLWSLPYQISGNKIMLTMTYHDPDGTPTRHKNYIIMMNFNYFRLETPVMIIYFLNSKSLRFIEYSKNKSPSFT